MIVKGIIKSIDFNGNNCVVRIPYFEKAGSDEFISQALISTTPGIYNGYKENDVVWIAFDEGMLETPVIIGKLYLGAAKEKDDPRGTINCETQSVSKTASIPFDTKLGTNLSDKQINTKAPFNSIESLASNLNRVDIEQGQNSRDIGNKLRNVVDIIGPNGEKIYSVIEQTADKISNEVVHKRNTTDPSFDPETDQKLGWDLTLKHWSLYTEGTWEQIENNLILSVQKDLDTNSTNNLFSNGTDLKLSVDEICKTIIPEFIKKPDIRTKTEEGKTVYLRPYDKATKKYLYIVKETPEKEHKDAEISEFLLTHLGKAFTKSVANTSEYPISDTDYKDIISQTDPSKNIYRDLVNTEIAVHTYEIDIETLNVKNWPAGWHAIIDIANTSHTLPYELIYLANNSGSAVKTYYDLKPTQKINCYIKVFRGFYYCTTHSDPEANPPVSARFDLKKADYWYVVTYYKVANSAAGHLAPLCLFKTTISDETNTLIEMNRNGLYVNGGVNATRGHIGQFNIGGTHTCNSVQSKRASGIYSDDYIKRFEDTPPTNKSGVYVGTDGIKIGDKFSVDANGNVVGTSFAIKLTEESQKEIQSVNKNYLDGNITKEDVWSNNKNSLDTLVAITSSDATVKTDTDRDNKVNPNTLIYSFEPVKDTGSLLVMPNVHKNVTYFNRDENWTFSFKLKHTSDDIINKIKEGTLQFYILLGSISNNQFDIAPEKYNLYKEFSSCDTYSRKADPDISPTSPISGSVQVPKKDIDKCVISTYIKNPRNEDIVLKPTSEGYSKTIENLTSSLLKIFNYDTGEWEYTSSYAWPSVITDYGQYQNPIVWGSARYLTNDGSPYSSCSSYYETCFKAYVLKKLIDRDFNNVVIEKDADGHEITYYKISVTLSQRYYNIYNDINQLCFGLYVYNDTNADIAQKNICTKEYKFEKSSIATDYILSAYDERNTAANAKTIAYSPERNHGWTGDAIKNWQGTSIELKYPETGGVAGLRNLYGIRQNDVITVQTRVPETSTSSKEVSAVIVYLEAANEGNLGGIVQFAYVIENGAKGDSINTKTYYAQSNNGSAPAKPTISGGTLDPKTYGLTPLTPSAAYKSIWACTVVFNNATPTKVSNPYKYATYEGMISILEVGDPQTGQGIGIIELDNDQSSPTYGQYFVKADQMHGIMSDKVTISGFTIGQTALHSPDTFNSMSATGNGVYLGIDGIKLGQNLTIDNTGEFHLKSDTVSLDTYVPVISGGGMSTSIDYEWQTITGKHDLSIKNGKLNIDFKRDNLYSSDPTKITSYGITPGWQTSFREGTTLGCTEYSSTKSYSIMCESDPDYDWDTGIIIGGAAVDRDWDVDDEDEDEVYATYRYDRGSKIELKMASINVVSSRLSYEHTDDVESEFGTWYTAIGTDSYPTIMGHHGNIYCDRTQLLVGTWSGTVSSGTGSDRRLKNNIEPLPDTYDILFDNLKPCRFKYNDGQSNRYHSGLIAQEVQDALAAANINEKDFAAIYTAYLPDAKTDDNSRNLLLIRYEELIALNISQIQKLKKRVTELEEKLNKTEKDE